MSVKKVDETVSDKVDDRYRVRLYNPAGGYYKKVINGKQAAYKHEAEMKAKLDRGGVSQDRGKVTVRELFEQIMAAKPNLAAHTVRSYGNHLRLHILPEFGDVKVGKLTSGLAISGFLERVEGNAGKSTRRSVESLMRAMLKTAVREGLLDRNPLAGVPFPKAVRVRGVPYAPELTEVMRLREHVRTGKGGNIFAGERTMFEAMVDTLTGSGVRIGELLGISRDDLDVDRLTLTINRQLVDLPASKDAQGNPTKQSWHFGPPKTDDSGPRTIPIPKFVADALTATLERNGTRSITLPWDKADPAAAKRMETQDLIFFSLREAATPIHAISVQNRISRLGQIVGMGGPLHPHCFRHRYTTVLHDAGVPQIVIDYVTGHLPSGSVTMTTYTQATAEGMIKARDAIAAAWTTAQRAEHAKVAQLRAV